MTTIFRLLLIISFLSVNHIASGQSPPQKPPKAAKGFIYKLVLDKRDGQNKWITVPKKCKKFNSGVSASLNAMVSYSDQLKSSLEFDYNKALVISQYSERMKTIAATQCEYLRGVAVINSNNSDYDFYNALAANYLEYQKVKDLIDNNPNADEKVQITNAILSVYESFMGAKKDPKTKNKIKFEVKVQPGNTVSLYINDKIIASSVADANGFVFFEINPANLPEGENSISDVIISVNYTGYVPSEISLLLKDLVDASNEDKPIKIKIPD